jgi:integrase
MFLIALCLGLRVNEILALKWTDFNFEIGTVKVQRGVVHGRISGVKTEYSEDELPIHPSLAGALLNWKTRCHETDEGWVFANSETGQPYHAPTIQQDYLRPAGYRIGLDWSVGWHTARHTYRSPLDDSGAPIGVQQKLMRHAQVSTTMDIYSSAYLEAKRAANGVVIGRILPQNSKSQAHVA